jgi:hypothetical protein
MASWRPLAIVAAALAAGCTHLPPSRHTRPPPSAELPDESYYEAPGPVPAPLESKTVETWADHDVDRILLPPRVPPDLRDVPRALDPIEITHYRPEGGLARPRPAIVLSPIMGNKTLVVGRFGHAFARRGWHAILVQRKELDFDPHSSLERAEDEVRLVVMRSRQAVDWLVQREDVDRSRLATFGVSAGAIVSAVLAGTDARFAAHAFVLGGGPMADVMADTVEKRWRRYEQVLRRTRGWSKEHIREALRRAIRSDPVAVAPRVPRDHVLMVLARRDTSVPTSYGMRLWEALGRPELDVTPFGHYTTFLLLPWLETRVTTFFRSRFGDYADPTGP